MSDQIGLRMGDEHVVAGWAAGRGMVGVADDLNDELTVICGFANVGESASGDVERTNSYFPLIDSAPVQQAADPTAEPPEVGSSFRHQLGLTPDP